MLLKLGIYSPPATITILERRNGITYQLLVRQQHGLKRNVKHRTVVKKESIKMP